jgi:hypothetical protein
MRLKRIFQLLLFQAIFLCSTSVLGQLYGNSDVVFHVDDENSLCFDPADLNEWRGQYQYFRSLNGAKSLVPVFSVLPRQESTIYAWVLNKRLKYKRIEFRIVGSNPGLGRTLKAEPYKGNQLKLRLPASEMNYTVEAYYNGDNLIGKLEVRVYQQRTEELIIVPVSDKPEGLDSLGNYLSSVFQGAKVRFNVRIDTLFDASVYSSISKFNSPSLEYKQFTPQMQELRDAYFQQITNYDQNAIYVFVIPGFKNEEIHEYAIKGKSLCFVEFQRDTSQFLRSIARSIGLGIGQLDVSWTNGPSRKSTDNLMDEAGGTKLRAFQWDNMNEYRSLYSYYDDYEQVAADNGRVAYYFWEEDEKGNIRIWDNDIMSSIRHPFKRNFQSYHLNIDDFMFQTRWTVWERNISFWHILLVLTGIGLAVFFKKSLDKEIDSRFEGRILLKFLVRLFGLTLGIGILVLGFRWIDYKYEQFIVKSGPVKELQGMTEFQAIREVKQNKKMFGSGEKALCSQVLIHKGNNWIKSKRKPVLYFKVMVKDDKILTCRFRYASDKLVVKQEGYSRKTSSQYMVFTYFNTKGAFVKQAVYNYKGNEITTLLKVQDPAKRILLFVNGYRSSVNSNKVEDQMMDLENKGLELPISTNMIYSWDRFRYWFWKGFDAAFRDRINPSDCFYADGNFSISTSNHRNIKNFLTLMTTYPKRCSNENRHVCYELSAKAKWLSLFKTNYSLQILRKRSNKNGFKKRFINGRIAGRNLCQLLNEIPNKSKNDTLFIVAHSMGYAYSLGMIEELRGKINFGGFYIIAPENAEAGQVNRSEWKEVWQFGANFNRGEEDAPCIQDGIAPQSRAKGLKEKHRVYIPKKLYKSRGFKQSHFIGLYTYMFDIPAGKKGHIQQH